MESSIYTIEGQDTGRKIQLNESIFKIEPSDHAIYLDVKQYLANQRQGTHKSKERGEIHGSTIKLKKQKGTGTARSGSAKSPLFTGGGRVFGPKPRDYSFKLNKKVKQLARKSALTYKASENSIIIVEDFNLSMPKTKQIISLKNNLKISDKKSIIVLSEQNKNIYLSSRNLPNTQVTTASELCTYDILNHSVLLVTEGAISKFDSLI